MDTPRTPRDGSVDQTDTTDPEAIGRLLLARQSQPERDQAREIFHKLLTGTPAEDLQTRIRALGQATAERANRLRCDARR